MEQVKKLLVPGIVLILVVAAGIAIFGGGERKTLTAHFPRTVSVYEGSDVRVLGVPIGEVMSVTPSGTDVEVKISYDADVKVPADAQALIVAPAVVGDRYIQLAPVYKEGEVLDDGAELSTEQTSMPLELDQIYQSIDDLTVALGPTGANKDGALSDLLTTTAENFGGQGAAFNQTIKDFGKFSGTLDDNKEELFGAAEKLGSFLKTLADNDETVRDFNTSVADVSKMLAGERRALKRSLRNLSTAMETVSTFVKDNRQLLGDNIKGLNRVSKVLVKQRGALDEILEVAPLALNNLALTYNPQAGTLDTRANLGELLNQVQNDPEVLLCGLVNQVDTRGRICDLIGSILPRSAAFGQGGVATSPERFDATLAGLAGLTEGAR
ncbi:MCE family protein [Nocardioides pacificus]